MSSNRQKFIDGYEKLVRETGWYVGACGCCNSPWYMEALDFRGQDVREEELKHLRDDDNDT